MPTSPQNDKTLSVSELNGIARSILEAELDDMWVEGELSNLAKPSSGHLYFTLKDDKAQIRCALFRNRGRLLRFEPDNGLWVRVNGRVSLYEPRGDYQLIVNRMEPAGEGALQQAFEQLKRKLFEAGLFDEALKKSLPPFPEVIGIATSPSGAAVRDILQILQRRYPRANVIVYPVQVQGDGSAEQIVAAIETANRRNESDLLIVTRGGGSIEDLWSFNDERVAKAIHASDLPIISAVGHEIDFTIADFVADLRAPTPSAAAEIATPEQAGLQQLVTSHETRLKELITSKILVQQTIIDNLRRRLDQCSPSTRLQQQRQRLDELERRLIYSISRRLDNARHHLQLTARPLLGLRPLQQIKMAQEQLLQLKRYLRQHMHEQIKRRRHHMDSLSTALNLLNPDHVLERGYAIVSRAENGEVISHANELSQGECIDIRFSDGCRKANIT